MQERLLHFLLFSAKIKAEKPSTPLQISCLKGCVLQTVHEMARDVYFRVSRQLQEILNRHDIKAPSLRQTVHLDR